MDPNHPRPNFDPQNLNNFDPSLTSHPQLQALLQAMSGMSANVPQNVQTYNFPPPNYQNPYSFPHNFQYPPLQNTYTQEQPTPNQGSSSHIPIDEEEDDDEIVPETYQTPVTEPLLSHPVPSRSRQQNVELPKKMWTDREDEALIACYMEHCTDQVLSTNQSGLALWRKVTASYEAAQASRPNELRERTLHMLKSRWRRLSADTMKWVGIYEEAKRMMGSGEQEQDVVARAKIIFTQAEGKNFLFLHAWNMLKLYNKWMEKVSRYLTTTKKKDDPRTTSEPASGGSNSSGKRVRLDDDDEGVGTYMSGGTPRPDGVKKAKAKRFAKGGSSTDEVAMSLGHSLEAHSQSKLEIERSKERRRLKQLEVEEKQVRVEEMKVKMQLLDRLEAKDSLTPQEEKARAKLLSELYGD